MGIVYCGPYADAIDPQGGVVLTEHSRAVLAAVERLEQLLDDLSGGAA